MTSKFDEFRDICREDPGGVGGPGSMRIARLPLMPNSGSADITRQSHELRVST
jgi:hypothetical protein